MWRDYQEIRRGGNHGGGKIENQEEAEQAGGEQALALRPKFTCQRICQEAGEPGIDRVDDAQQPAIAAGGEQVEERYQRGLVVPDAAVERPAVEDLGGGGKRQGVALPENTGVAKARCDHRGQQRGEGPDGQLTENGVRPQLRETFAAPAMQLGFDPLFPLLAIFDARL